MPVLRCLTGCKAEPVSVDTVLKALAELDRDAIVVPVNPMPPRRRARRLTNLRHYLRSRRRNDDNGPPPCPAAGPDSLGLPT